MSMQQRQISAATSVRQVAIEIPETPTKTEAPYHLESEPEKAPWYVVTKPHLRECMGEVFGTFLMAVIGLGGNNAVMTYNNKHAATLTSAFCWGIGVMFGIQGCQKVSGSTLNPAVAIQFACYRGFPWWKLPGLICSQVLGCFCAAAVVYVYNIQVLNDTDPGRTSLTRGRFATYPADGIKNYTAFMNEFMAGFVLIMGVSALTDQRNAPAAPQNFVFHFFFLITAICYLFGINTMCALNPARDLGPRIFTYLVGYGSDVFTTHNHYFWIPIVGPLLGGSAGGGLYRLMVANHHPPLPTQA